MLLPLTSDVSTVSLRFGGGASKAAILVPRPHSERDWVAASLIPTTDLEIEYGNEEMNEIDFHIPNIPVVDQPTV